MSIQTATNQFNAALEDAKSNLAEAKQGVIHWEGQVTKLTELQAAMAKILSPEDFEAPPPKATRSAKTSAKPKQSAKGVEIPATSSEFFMSLLSATPQKTDAILAAGAKKLGISGDDKLNVLRGRQTAFLQKNSADGKIKSEGERANRTYFI